MSDDNAGNSDRALYVPGPARLYNSDAWPGSIFPFNDFVWKSVGTDGTHYNKSNAPSWFGMTRPMNIALYPVIKY